MSEPATDGEEPRPEAVPKVNSPYRSRHVNAAGLPARHQFIPSPKEQGKPVKFKGKSDLSWIKKNSDDNEIKNNDNNETDNENRKDLFKKNSSELDNRQDQEPIPLRAILKPAGERDKMVKKPNKMVSLGTQVVIPDPPAPSDTEPKSVKPSDAAPKSEKPSDAEPKSVKPSDAEPKSVKPSDTEPKSEEPSEVDPMPPPPDPIPDPPVSDAPSTPSEIPPVPPPVPIPELPDPDYDPEPGPSSDVPEPSVPLTPVVITTDLDADDDDEEDGPPAAPPSEHSSEGAPRMRSDSVKRGIEELNKSMDLLSNRLGSYMERQSTGSGTGIPPAIIVPFGGPLGASRGHSLRGSNYELNDPFRKGPPGTGLMNHDKEVLLDDEKDEEAKVEKRGHWGNHVEFLLSCLGYAVGLGNVWRFPYLCYRNGGGAFFIPYFIMLFLVGIPIFFLELSLGQFTGSSPLTAWKFAPILGGVGIGMCLVSTVVCLYYNMIIGYGFYYLFASFTSKLPWSGCDNYWNDDLCWSKMPLMACNTTDLEQRNNGTCYSLLTGKLVGMWNLSVAEGHGIYRQTPSQQYWDRHVLEITDGLHDMGGIKWEIALVYFVAWFVVFLCLSKGIKTSGKAVYFTAIFPYVVLLALVIRGVTLEGAAEGIRFYTTADLSRLKEARVWIDATNQIFFSLSDCFGGLITLASYNNFHRNTLRDSLLVSVGNCLTSIFAGFAVFSLLGFLAAQLGVPVDKVAKGGVDLAFVVYPEALTRMPAVPTLWSILFFLMIITLGLDTMFALVETVTSSLLDKYSQLKKHQTTLTGLYCLLLYLIGLSVTSRGGIYLVQLLDSYGGAWAMLIIALVESLGITWIYGRNNFIRDIRTMIGRDNFLLKSPLGYWWVAMWGVVTPVLLVAVILFAWIDFSPASYGDYIFPPWADAIGLLITTFIVIFIPIYAIYLICKAKGSFLQRLWAVTTPTYDWGPPLPKHRKLVAEGKPDYIINLQHYRRTHQNRNFASVESGTQYVNPSFDHQNFQ